MPGGFARGGGGVETSIGPIHNKLESPFWCESAVERGIHRIFVVIEIK